MYTMKKWLCFLANLYSANAVKRVKREPIRMSLKATSVMPRGNLWPPNQGTYPSGNPKVKYSSQVQEQKAESSKTDWILTGCLG